MNTPGKNIGGTRALQNINEHARRDRLDPKVHAWATKALHKWLEDHQKQSASPVEIGQLLLEEFGKIRGPTLDADDAAVAFAAAVMSLGAEVVFIGESYTKDGSIHHVAVGVKDREWYYRFDPLYGHGPDHIVEGRTRFEKFPWGEDCE